MIGKTAMTHIVQKTALAGVLAASATMAAAQDTPADHSQDLAWHNQQQLALAQRSYKDGWSYLEGGVLWRRISGNGSGPSPSISDTVSVHYQGSFVDGSIFDSSYDRGQPVNFPLGKLIPAWKLAIPQMGVGDTIELAVPSSLGYGPRGKGPIPGGATLLFEIKLLGIEGG